MHPIFNIAIHSTGTPAAEYQRSCPGICQVFHVKIVSVSNMGRLNDQPTWPKCRRSKQFDRDRTYRVQSSE